jgi:hypothetical protein
VGIVREGDEAGARQPAPLRGTARTLALVWVVAVVGLYLAVRFAGLDLVR